MSRPKPHATVRRRAVLYIPGYDPMPPRAYRERYRREAARQAVVSGHTLSVRGRGGHGWDVVARVEGYPVHARIDVLYWADIVRSSMVGGIVATYGQLVRTAWVYLSSGALLRLARLRNGPVIAALFPVVVLLAQLVIAGAIGAMAAAIAHAGLVFWFPQAGGAVTAAAVVLAGTVIWRVLRWFQLRDPLLAWYLMHDYAFSARHDGAYPAVQEARMDAFADQIAKALQSDVNEVLVVGHSSGAYIAVSVLAGLIRAGRVGADGPVLSLLTLGQVIPMVSFLPQAARLRADLALMSETRLAYWVDVTAPGDGCSFALCDPVAVSGVAGPDKRGPLILSAAFSQTLSAQAWAALRWRFFERHFQYLNAFDNLEGRGDAYDYFAVTAGPRTVEERFCGRKPSRQRIETAVNLYTDRAA